MSLQYHFKGLMNHNKDGSFSTQRDRSSILLMCASQIREGGFKLLYPRQLKQKHMNYLVERWKSEELSPSTIKNRTSNLRWLAEKIQKNSIVKSNDDYGIDKRQFATQIDKSTVLDERVDKIASENIKDALRLADLFGLRREEALKFTPELSCQLPDRIVFKKGTKGGFERYVLIRTEAQRTLVKTLKERYPTGSLIPKSFNYNQYKDKYANAVRGSGLGNGHGLRHGYAQGRYEELTGWKCSVKGGLKYQEMDEKSKKIDREVRLQISKEIGHRRIDVIDKYIGK